MDPHLEQYTLKQMIAVLIIFLAVFLTFSFLYSYLTLPDDAALIEFAEKYYATHGYSTVFIAAIVEGLLLVNWMLVGLIAALILWRIIKYFRQPNCILQIF